MRKLIYGTADLLLFLFLFIFGHAVLIIKDKVGSLTHSLYILVYGRPPKKEKKISHELSILLVLVFVLCYYYIKLL